jgi:filamentous hemagglutinin family protein
LLRRLIAHPLEFTLALVLASTPLGGAFANPQGGQVAAGAASITGQGTATVTVNQSSQSVIINWNTFNIAAGELTKFVQPSASAIALNRVIGGLGPSQIYGHIQANGRIILVNRDGILFGMGSRVDAAGFLATTNNISNRDFMAGHYNFNMPGRLNASIVNLGHINATNGGFAALVAPGVRNDGVITANLGQVALASGNGFTLDFYGDKLITLQVGDSIAHQVIDVATGQPLDALVKNEGKLRANGGTVSLTAVAARHVVDAVINTSGVIEANSVGSHAGMIVLGTASTGTSKLRHLPVQKVVISGTLSVKGSRSGRRHRDGEGDREGDSEGARGGAVEGALGGAVAGPAQNGGTIVINGGLVDLAGATFNGSRGSTASIYGHEIKVTDGGLTSNNMSSITLSAVNSIDINAPLVVNGATTLNLLAAYTPGLDGVPLISFGPGGNVEFVGTSDSGQGLVINHQRYTLLYSMSDVQAINNEGLSGRYALANSMDATGVTGWVPIGTDGNGQVVLNDGRGFNGTFQGLGNTISNLTINQPSGARVGLFGFIGSTGSVQNLGLIGGSVTGGSSSVEVGALAGFSQGTISRSYATSDVTGDRFVGGLVGENQGTITGSYAGGNVIGSAVVGGLVGGNLGGTVESSHANGAVGSVAEQLTSNGFIPLGFGGLVGINGGGLAGNIQAPGTIKNSFATGTVTVTTAGEQAGGLVGGNDPGSHIINSHASGTVNDIGGASFIGGLVGDNFQNATIRNSFATGAVNALSGGSAIGGLVGTNSTGATISNSSATGAVTSTGSEVGGLAGNNSGNISQSFASGAVVGNAHVGGLIGDGPGNVARSHATGNVTGVSEVGGLIGQFSVNLGGNLTQSYATGNVTGTTNVGGLIGNNGGTVSHSYATGAVSGGSGSSHVGGLIGNNATGAKLTNVYATGVVIGGDRVGGLLGAQSNGASVSSSYATGDVHGETLVGGLVGGDSGLITKSYATGNVSGTTAVGGLVGQSSVITPGGTISLSYATGSVTGVTDVGGLVGNNAGVINQSFATGTVTGTTAVGGLVGQNVTTGVIKGRRLPTSNDTGCGAGFTCASGAVSAGAGGDAGGLVGFNAGTIRNAFATGTVDVGTNGSGGGLVGLNVGTISRTFATGNVTGAAGAEGDKTRLGGLVGQNQGIIAHSFATGMVGALGIGQLDVGGLVGQNTGVIRFSYATGDVLAGDFSSAGGLVAENHPSQDCGDCTESSAKISHSHASGNVTVGSNSVAGGLVAVNEGTIRRSGANSNVSGADNNILGGLVGVNDLNGEVSRSSAGGSVTATGQNSAVGGLVGLNGGDIRNSRTRAAVSATGNSYVGGFAGLNIGSIIDSHVFGNASVAVSGTGNIVGGFVGANMGMIDPSTTDVIPQAGSGNVVGSFAGANLAFSPSTFNGLAVPPPSFPAGTISSDSQNTNSSPNQPPFTGTTTTTSNPSTPGVINSCTDAICQIFQTGFLNSGPPQPPAPPQQPQPPTNPSSSPDACDASAGGQGCTQPPPQQVVVPPNFALNTQPTLVNLTTDNGGAGGTGGNGGNRNGNNNGPGTNNSPGPPPGPGLGRTLDEQRFSGVPPIGETRFLKGEVVVQISNTVPMATVLQIAQQLGITLVSSQSVDLNGRVIYRFKAANGKDIRRLIRALERNRIVASAQPNYVFGLTQSAPAPATTAAPPAAPAAPPAAEPTGSIPPKTEPVSEPGLANAATASLETLPAGDAAQYVIDKMHLVQIHGVARGRGVVVAVIDSEIDVNHPDLQGIVVDRFDATQGASHPHPHGTGMAGAIAAHKRLLGVAPGVRLIAIKAFDEQAASAEATSFQILKGLDYALAHKARIINMSFAGPRDPMMERTLKIAHDKGVILVAAAGNAGPKSPPLYPGADPSVIAVTASDYNDRPFAMANRGKYIAVAAPGVDVMVPAPGNTYQLTTGTSVATAHVSGVAALLVERKPTITPDEVRAVLMRTATPYTKRPKGEEDGAGLVDPIAALQSLTPNQAVNAPRPSATTLH